MEERKKKIAIVAVCSTILVAMVVVGVVVTLQDNIGKKDPEKEVSTSQKAISTICETTDHPSVCLDSLKGQNSTNPKELIEVAFKAAVADIVEAAKKSVILRQAQADPRAKTALDTCGELASRAVNDLQRSYAKFNSFDITGNIDDILMELKIWLSGSITYQETCLDGFQNVSGDAGQKMREALNVSMDMTSNSLAMVAELSTYLEAMGLEGGQGGGRRRLLSSGEIPSWMDVYKRRLLTASPQQIRPNLIVAKDGSGQYKTINEALKNIPKSGKNNNTFVLYIKEGVYEEKVMINNTHLMIIGDGPTKTKITGKLNFVDGTNTFHTATVAVQGDDFIARDIGFENTAGPEKHQAVALRVSADKAIFYNCQMDGYQDTLYAHTYRQFYRDCTISGTIDFIFGDSASIFQGCTLVVRKPLDNQQCIVTAQGRKEIRQPTGLVLQNCTFKADPEYYPLRTKIKTYLGRPWKKYSRTIIMESFLDDLIQPEGWLPWDKNFALDTLFYTEFNNRGPAAPKSQRVKWAGVKELPPDRVVRFTAAQFLDGNRWIQPTQLPYAPGFIFPAPKEDPNIKYSPVVPEENKDLGSAAEKSSSDDSSKDSSSKKKKKDDSEKDDSKSAPPPPSPPPPPPPTNSPPVVPELDKTAPALIIVPPPEPSPSEVHTFDLGTSPPILDLTSAAISPSQPDNILASIPGFTDILALPPTTLTGNLAPNSQSPPTTLTGNLAPNSQSNELANPNSISPSPSSGLNIPETDLSISPSIAPSGNSASFPDQSGAAAASPHASLPLSLSASPGSSPQSDVQDFNQAASPPMLNEIASSPIFNEAASAFPPISNEASSVSSPISNEVGSSPISFESAASPMSNEAASPTMSSEVASPPMSIDAAFSPMSSEAATSPMSSEATPAFHPMSTEAAHASAPTNEFVSTFPPVAIEGFASSLMSNVAASAFPPISNEVVASPPMSNVASSASPPVSNEAASSPASPPLPNEAASPSASPPLPNEVATASPPVPHDAASASPPLPNEAASASASPPLPNEAASSFASPPLPNGAATASQAVSNEATSTSPPVPNKTISASPPAPMSNEVAASSPSSPSGSSTNSSQNDLKESKEAAASASPPAPSVNSSIEKSNEAIAAPPPTPTSSNSGSTTQSEVVASPPPSSTETSVSTPQSDGATSPPPSSTGSSVSMPQSDGAASPPPPSTGSSVSTPQSDGAASPPPSSTGSSVSTPQSDGAASPSPPSTVSSVSTPPLDGAASQPPPSTGSSVSTPPLDGAASQSPPSTGSSVSTPPLDGAASPPPSTTRSSVSTPQSDGATSPPTNPSSNSGFTPPSDAATTTPQSSDSNVDAPSLN